MKFAPSTTRHLPLLFTLTLSLLALSVQAKHLSSPHAKTSHLLHCLGHAASAKADRAKVEALIAANPNPADDRVWSQLLPREWGFKGHDAPGGDTWTPVDGATQTVKDRVSRQHQKLIRCAKRLQMDVMRDADGDAKPADQAQEPRVLPDMFGGSGFKQVRQNSNGFPLRQPQAVAKNDAQSIAPGPGDPAEPADPANPANPGNPANPAPGPGPAAGGGTGGSGDGTTQQPTPNYPKKVAAGAGAGAAAGAIPGSAAGAGTGTTPGAGQGAVAPGDLDASAAQKSNPDGTLSSLPPGGLNPAADAQKPNPDGTLSSTHPGQKLAPGLGPDQVSVAPALTNDPLEKNMPKTLPGTAAAADTDPAQQGAAVAGHPLPAGTDPQTMAAIAAVAANMTNNGAQTDPNGQKSAVPGQLNLALANDATADQSEADGTASTCTNPLIRKEYSSLTRGEKKAFVEAIKCVRSKPSRFNPDLPEWNAADDWTLLHIRMVRYVHFTAYFTVFHRGFTAIVERDLNDCGFKFGIPWVDWTKTASDPSTNPVFDSDPEFGLGTDGKGDNSSCPWNTGLAVTDGALADHTFNAPFQHRLCRQFNNLDVHTPNPHFGSNCTTFINADFIKGLGATHDDGKFFDFSSALEISTHLSMHTCVGGNLAWLSSSPNDILFHTHHSCVDNLFGGWQKKSGKNKRAFHGPKQQQKNGKHPEWTAKVTDVINFQPLAENVMVRDLLDHESGAWGGRMCYRYDYNIEM
ncbi:uncharacterized protein SPSC_01152 [Sporisorium scitamineum]|uniref:Tyrosinase copper-binding domain-containing protein n=1 Tax=Sporisorium scitamineum TaxID=49012 RepID=A0A127Z996_9BASI|nr:uncharacterized protein SPSC_01152 [Sporisorium scitamineum]